MPVLTAMAVPRSRSGITSPLPYSSVNGLNMYYEVHGAGPPLLLLHGGAGSIPEKWIPLFSPQFQVIAMEQMGHGRTADLSSRPFHYHDMAEDTVELMGLLEIESAAVVGYSDGGIIALEMAIHHPERVAKLAVTGANFRIDGTPRRIWSGYVLSIPMLSQPPPTTLASPPMAWSIGPYFSDACRKCGAWNQTSRTNSYKVSPSPP